MNLRAVVERHRKRNVGRLQYLRAAQQQLQCGQPFNGQVMRRAIYADLLARCRFECIIETGTYKGRTTLLFAESVLPVYTVEHNPLFFGYAQMQLRGLKNVHLFQNDSRNFLEYLAGAGRLPTQRTFFYLDAHWGEHLPLAEEIRIINKHWRNAVVMIDDFQVPGTTYGYDDFGPLYG